MKRPQKLSIARMQTGRPGFDEVLGCGLPEYSFNLFARSPGTGMTTPAPHLTLANPTRDNPALCESDQ